MPRPPIRPPEPPIPDWPDRDRGRSIKVDLTLDDDQLKAILDTFESGLHAIADAIATLRLSEVPITSGSVRTYQRHR